MNHTTPLRWLHSLKEILDAAQCRVDNRSSNMEEGLKAVMLEFQNALEKNASVWWIGNGGSAAICSHLSQDLLNKIGCRSLTLNDVSLLTCMANDFGYENVYVKPLKTLMQPGDLLIAISSSGKSKNILACANLAIEKKAHLITLSAFDQENPLWKHPANVSFYLPSRLYGQVEVGHEAILHSIIETMWLQKM